MDTLDDPTDRLAAVVDGDDDRNCRAGILLGPEARQALVPRARERGGREVVVVVLGGDALGPVVLEDLDALGRPNSGPGNAIGEGKQAGIEEGPEEGEEEPDLPCVHDVERAHARAADRLLRQFRPGQGR